MSRKDVVTLRVVSPCEHGREHEIKELHEGAEFSTFDCVTAKGVPRYHRVTAEKYPDTIRRT